MNKRYEEINFKTVSELVDLGKSSGMAAFAAYINGIENEIGKGAELHPDWMDTIFEAAEDLGWNEQEYFKVLGWA
jgi:hypothetical protein